MREEMIPMKNIKIFERELSLIVDEDLRMAVKSFMEEHTPAYFWTDGASASGKYHPKLRYAESIAGLFVFCSVIGRECSIRYYSGK